MWSLDRGCYATLTTLELFKYIGISLLRFRYLNYVLLETSIVLNDWFTFIITDINYIVQYDWWLDPGQSRSQAVILRVWILGV